jgi:hypothetical protein
MLTFKLGEEDIPETLDNAELKISFIIPRTMKM